VVGVDGAGAQGEGGSAGIRPVAWPGGDRGRGFRQERPEPPCGSRPLPSPARTCVVAFIGISSSLRAGRAGPGRCLRQRGRAWSRSSGSPLRSGPAVGVDAAALTGTDVRGRVHRDLLFAQSRPSGSMPLPSPARTWVVVFIASLQPVLGQPSGSMVWPWPARMRVVVLIAPLVSRWGRCRRRGRRGCVCSCSSRAPVQGPPLGSIIPPWPARMLVFELMCRSCGLMVSSGRREASAVGIDARPAACANVGEGLHGCSWSGRGYAVGVEAGTLAGAEGGGGVHGPPMGSMHDPVPARTRVLVRMEYLGVRGIVRAADLARLYR
jgi:hypothetical protein